MCLLKFISSPAETEAKFTRIQHISLSMLLSRHDNQPASYQVAE